MAVYKIYHKDGSILSDANGKEIEVHSIEYNGTWMGECFVTVTFENEAPISFSIGDYIEYRGERFEINYDPGKIKCASKGSYGGAFKYDSVKFNALSDELVRCDMLDLVLYDNNLHYTALPQFAFYVESLDDLLDRIQANLDELYGKAVWKLYSRNKECSIQRGCTAEGWESAYGAGTTDNVIDSTSISISDQNCWDALSLVNSKFDVNFIIRDRNVYVGTAGVPTANIFKYGKDKGLYEIEQNSESDQAIVTRLRAYGSNRNLPNHYYADLGSIPFLNITGDYHDGSTDSGLSVMMEDSVYAGMFTDIISDNGSNMKHCRIRGSIDGYEFDGVVELVKKDSTKSTTRLLVEGKAVCDAIKAKIDAGIVQVDFISGANKTKFNGNRINYVSNLPNNMACDRLMLPGFPNKSLSEWWNEQSEAKKAWLNPGGKGHDFSVNRHRPYVDSLNIDSIGVRPASVFFDQDDKVNGIVEIYPTIEGMEVDGVRIDEIYMGTNIEDDGRFGDGETVANVPIYLSPKVNFDIRALMQEDFTIHMKDGMCAGREFKVAGCTKEKDGSWKLMIERKPDDSLNLYFPYNDFQIKKGDHFVLSGIELPDAYVEAASEKLLRYCIAYLDKNDYTRYVYQPKVDEIFMARQHDTAMADASGLTKSLYLTLKEGDIMLFKDDDLGIDAEITIDQLTIKEEDGKIPTYEITLREEKEVGTIQKIQNQISSITNGNGGSFTGGTGGGGLSSSQIKNLIDAIGSDRFLSKLNDDVAAGVITFLKGTNWGNFTSETGAAMTVDPSTGQTYMEVDRLKVRLKAFFEQLEIQKVGFVGGKLIVTKGQGVDILDVENIYDSEGNVSAYRCYFLGEQEGRKIDNLLRVKDQMICKDFNVSEGSTDGATNKYYWRLVTAVSSDVVKRGNYVCHWVDLSATDCDTNSDIPEIGDTICHLGNREDTDRQGAEILSVVDANSPSFTIYSGINSYSLVNKEYIDMGVAGGKAFCNIYGSTYIGDRNRENGYISWDYDKEENVWKMRVKGTIDITSQLSSGGTIGGAITDAANAYKGEFDAFTSNVNEVIGGFQAQIDGVIETWFYDPEPTLGNLPASEWKDNTTKDKHLGDLYYSKSGLAYRFQKEGDIYKWVQIDDTAITSALKEAKAAKEAAAAAQGTADTAQTTAESKMKVFVVQPTNNDEYSIGDMWVNATYSDANMSYSNDILKCKEGKAAGAEFKIAHWEKASKYTDDTKANEAQKTANAAAAAAKNIDDAILAIDNNVDVALKDKIITKTEAAAITEALNSLSAIMADVTKTYAELVNNAVYQLIAADTRKVFKDTYDRLVATFNALSDYITNTLTKANPITSDILSTYESHYRQFKTDYEAYVSKLNVVRNSMDALLNTRIGDIASMLGGLKATKDAMDETTQINGGLILSTLLALGYTDSGNNFNVMSGVSGLYESDTEKGGGIAFWAGGHRIDINDCTKNEDGTYSYGGKVVNPADFLVRHDGTGYAAGGSLWWEKDGKVHADPQSFLINEQYVGNVMQLFKFIYSGGTAFENIVHAIPQKPFESLSIGANGLTIYNGNKTAKLYMKDNGVLFIEGDLAVTGGITMYASDGVKSGMIDQVYAVLDQSLFSIVDGVITITGEIGSGTVKGITINSTKYDPDANGIIALTLNWGDLTGVPTTFTPSAHNHDDRYYTESEIDTKLGLKLDTSLKGAADGIATLDSSGKVPSSQLPSYVDDVLEYANKASFPTKGESGKIYIDKETNLTYRWGGTAYVEISQSLALGETSSTAYAGDKGKQNATDIAALKTGKADKATTLAGYGITDAYTKTQTYTQAEVNTKLTDGSVTKVGKVDVGSATKPIYLKAGVPTAVGTSLAVDITGNSATTSKLKTAVTLWGQSFDGSKAITGNLTNVGTITPTGEDLKVVGNLIVTGGIVMYADDGATIESGFAALLAAHIDGVTIKYNEAQQKIYSVMTGIKVNGATYKPSETDGYITIPDYPTSLDWENIENKPSTFTPSSHTHTFASLTSKPTTLSGYGITDAKIANGVITLGTATITPLTTHQTVTLASGTNNGTLKLTVGSKTTDNIAVKGLGSAAYTASSAYAAASHTHSQYLVASSLDGYINALTDNTSANVFVTAISKSGKTLSYSKSFTKKSLTAASHSGWSSADTDKLIIPDMSFIAYWNGAYNSSGGSNLAYCNKGAFGDMATAAKSSYYTKTEVNTKLGDGSVTKLGTGTTGAANTPIYWSNGKPAAVTLVDTANNLINSLTTGTTTPVDADYYITQYAGGGTTTTTYHRRPHSALYAYIKGKAEGTWAISISGNAATASKLGTANVGSGTQHFYLSGGTATASTSTVGGTAKPMYLKAGVMTAISDTIGSASLPVYLNAGTITACSTTLGVSITGNAATATKLAATKSLWGQNFDGSANISGNMSGVGQITFSALSGTNGRALLYQQMADNDYFRIYCGGTGNNGGYAEIATADDGTEPIYVRQYSGVFGTLVRTLTLLDGNGNTTVPGLLTAANGTVNGTLKVGAIPVTNSSTGVLKIDGNLIVTGGITMYATDGVASGLMEQILVDGTTIGKKADGTLYAINTGNVRSIIMGSTTYTPNDSGAVTLPEKVTWANIEGKPSTFAPSSHTHTISQITNLQTTLDGKAAASHTHSYLPLSGGTMTGTIKYGGANYEIIRTGGDDTGWRGGLKYSWSSNTTIALWGKHINSQFVWHAGTDFSSNDVDGTTTRTYDFQVGRANGILEALIGGNKIWHAGNDGSGSGLDADTLDGYHASGLIKFYLSPMTSDAPADSAKSWFTNTMPSASGAIVYNVPGSEKTIIAGKSSGAYGHMLQLNYDDNYLRVLRYYNGSWKSTDWEKISAGYADSSGNADTLDGNHASAFATAGHTHSYLPLSGGTMTGAINLSNANAKLAFGVLTTSPITGYKAPTLSTNGVGIYSRYGDGGDEGAIIITEDTCVIYNSADTGWNFQVMDKDLGTDLTNDATRSFGVNQAHQAWSLAGFVKSGSSDSYVLLGGGGHKLISDFATSSHTHSYLPLGGGTLTGALTISAGITSTSAFVNTGDSTLKVYSGRITDAKSDGNICLQTSIDGTDGQSHAYPTQYGSRCNLVLQPRGGQVYIGTNPDGGNTSYKLYVNGGVYASSFTGNASSATKLTSSAGSATLPIYFSDGKPVACTASSVFSNLSNSGNNISVTVAGQNRTLTVGYADTVDGWHLGEFHKSACVTSPTSGLSSYWGKLWDITITTWQYNDMDMTLLLHSSYNSRYSIVNVRLRQNGSSGAYNFSASLHILTGNISTSDMRLYYNNSTGACSLWVNCWEQYGVVNCKVLSYTMRTGSEDKPHGTFYTTTFSSAQTLPSSSYVNGTLVGNVANSDTCDGLHVHGGRNNEANKIVRTDGNGYLQVGYINSSNGHEKNASSPTYVWGSNSSDSYLRSYQTSKLAVYTASKWATARKITLTGSVTGSVSIDGSGDVTLATTTNHTHSYLPLSGGTITGELYISGHLLTIGTRGRSNNPNRAELHLVSNSDNPCDLWLGSNSGEKWSITSRSSSEGYVLGLYCTIDGVYKMYVNPNGNICIGSNSSPSYKLQVDGSFYSSSVKTGLYVNIGNNNLSTYDRDRAEIDFVTSTDNVAEMWFGVANTRKWALCCRNSSENYRFALYNPQGGAYAMIIDTSSNLLVTGGITMYSDLRKKNILSNEVLSVKEIAAAPLFRHTYKSDDNQYIHVGTSAQYWSGIHEDWFTRKDSEGYYQMELQNLGVAMGISLAREIVKYESKTDKKIRLMKKKINDLEEANKALDARIKELEERRTA